MPRIRRHYFEISPLRPRLWGRSVHGPMRYGAYDSWVMESTPTSITIRPGLRSYRAMTITMLAAAIILPILMIGVVGWPRIPRWDQVVEIAPLLTAASAMCVLPAGYFYFSEMAAARMGLMLDVSLVARVLTAPRCKLKMPVACVVRIELICGKWWKGLTAPASRVCEIHLIARRRSGRIVSIPIVGAEAKGRKLVQAADKLGTLLEIPVVAISDTTNYGKVLAAHRAHRCVKCSYSLRGNTSGVCPECGTLIPTGRVDPPVN